VRYSESIVESVERIVEEGTFDHKSEFYRFATELLLDQLDEDYDPEMLRYDTLSESTQQNVPTHAADQSDKSMFYRSAIVVRRHARRGDVDSAEDYIDTHYPSERGEYLLLEALLDYYDNMNDSK
jgi:Arc/MetJ-type ribon-helix-helix transcriptional regulator